MTIPFMDAVNGTTREVSVMANVRKLMSIVMVIVLIEWGVMVQFDLIGLWS